MNIAGLFSMLDAAGFKTIQILISLSWMALLLFVFTMGILFILRKSGVVFKHLVWTSFICVLPVLPFIVWFASIAGTPQVELPMIPAFTLQYQQSTAHTGPGSPVRTVSNQPEAAHPFSIRQYPWAIIFTAYLTGVLFFLAAFVYSRMRMRYWRQHGYEITDMHILNMFRSAAVQLGVSQAVPLIESPDIKMPLTIGTTRPVILLPVGFADGLSDVELHALAIHEYAHIKRFDSLVLTATVVIRALLFFHPAVWYAARNISLLAEKSCDDAVVAIVKKPADYAKLLTRMAVSFSKHTCATELAAGFFISRHDFLHRVESILSTRKEELCMKSRSIISGLACYITAILLLSIVMPSCSKVNTVSNRKIDRGLHRKFFEFIMNYDPDDKTSVVTVSGIVVDPNGKPVANATVAPVLTGTGDFTGDNRYFVKTDNNGNFTIILPTTGEFPYNLIAHDGTLSEWKSTSRTWGNGITESFTKKPGEFVNDMIISLTEPCTVSGTVRDTNGKPLANHPLRARAEDLMDNRYLDPKTFSDANGNFVLERLRPGTHLINGSDLIAREGLAPDGLIRWIQLKQGETKDNIILLGMTKTELLEYMNSKR